MQVIKPVAVIAAGAGLALVLAAAAFFAAFLNVGFAVADWMPVEATRMVVASTAVLLVHLLWMTTWWRWRRLGWARFVAAVLLVPVAGLLAWVIAASAWEVSTRGNGWSWGRGSLQEPAREVGVLVPMILVPATVVAISVLVTALVPARDPKESMFVRPAWEPRTLLRAAAVTAAALGCIVLAAILVFLLLAMSGLV